MEGRDKEGEVVPTGTGRSWYEDGVPETWSRKVMDFTRRGSIDVQTLLKKSITVDSRSITPEDSVRLMLTVS